MIKVTFGEKPQQESKPFPKLMKGMLSGVIVLFTNEKTGTVIKGNEDFYEGWCDDTWNMKNFTDYNEPVTIQNT